MINEAALQKLIDAAAPEIMESLIEAAQNGNIGALKYCLPPPRPPCVTFKFDASVDTPATAASNVLEAVAHGELAPAEAAEILPIIEAVARLNTGFYGGAPNPDAPNTGAFTRLQTLLDSLASKKAATGPNIVRLEEAGDTKH